MRWLFRAPLVVAALAALTALTACDGVDVDVDNDVDVDVDVDVDADVEAEQALVVPDAARGAWRRDRFGGLENSGLPTARTGFFHVEKPAGAARTWLVDPDGNPYFVVGINTVLRSAGAPAIARYVRRFDGDIDRAARVEWDRMSDGDDGGFGYGFNAALGFSHVNDFTADSAAALNPITRHAPYGIVLNPSARDDSTKLRSIGGVPVGEASDDDAALALGDPYNPRTAEELRARFAPIVQPNDPNLIMYFVGNEIGLLDHPLHTSRGVRDFRRFLWSRCPSTSTPSAPQCAPHALQQFLTARYGTIDALNAAWGGRGFTSFASVIDKRPQPGSTSGTHKCTAECPDDLQRFWRQTLRAWVAVTTTTIRDLDPNHLIAAPRMSVATSSEYCFFGIDSCADRFLDGRAVPQRELYSPWSLLRREGNVGFDVVAINVYSRPGRAGFDEPWFAQGIHKVTGESGLPVIISEFGVRSIQPGWSNSGGAPAYVPSGGDVQARRGRYYQIDMNRFLEFRNIIGASFHRWADRFDEEDQINMGLVQRDGSRWRGMDTRVRGFNQSVYGKIADKTGL